MSSDQYDVALAQAHQRGQRHHPGAPAEHHAAFANSVAYAVTAISGGYGGPSMREHWAARLIYQAGTPGEISFAKAVEIVEQACYGPLTLNIATMLVNEDCFDDPPGEQELAPQLLSGGVN